MYTADGLISDFKCIFLNAAEYLSLQSGVGVKDSATLKIIEEVI